MPHTVWFAVIHILNTMSYTGNVSEFDIKSVERNMAGVEEEIVFKTPDDCMIWLSRKLASIPTAPESFRCERRVFNGQRVMETAY